MTDKPKTTSSFAQKELDRAEKQFEKFEEEVKSLTQDRMNAAPKEESEPQTKMSQSEIAKSKEIYLKPERTFMCKAKFNEKFRDSYNFDKEYVQFIAENKEIIGEAIEIWTKPYAGVACEFWRVPVNKPVWGPRYLAEQIKSRIYHRLKMDQTMVSSADGLGQYFGSMVVDVATQRLDAVPVSSRKSVFMGASSFK